jgi:YD repeat-containing protein
VKEVKSLSGVNVTTAYTYDLLGRLTGLTDPLGSQWVYTYDALGRRTSASDPDLGLWTYSYDAKGRLVRQTVSNRTPAKALVNRTYEAHNGLRTEGTST